MDGVPAFFGAEPAFFGAEPTFFGAEPTFFGAEPDETVETIPIWTRSMATRCIVEAFRAAHGRS